MTPMQWNDPRATWPLASFERPERRQSTEDRRADERRSTEGDRRKANRRSIRSLLRL